MLPSLTAPSTTFDNFEVTMAYEDSHSLSFNLASSIGSTTRTPVLFPSEYEVWTLHFEDYVMGLEEDADLIWQSITVGTHEHNRKPIKTNSEYQRLLMENKDLAADEKARLQSNIKALRIIRFALPSDTLRLVSSYDTAKGIWDRLKELYSGDADLEHSVQTTLLGEFGAFAQKADEKLEQTFNRYNHLLSRMLKYKLERSMIEQKVTFLNGLRPEWKTIVSQVKAHEQFKNYTLAVLVGILKSHEDGVMKDHVLPSLGNLALVAKPKKTAEDDSESDISDSELTHEDKALMVSNPRKFFKKNFSRFKNRSHNSNFSGERFSDNKFKVPADDSEKKLVQGDSGYDCHYCKGKNHFSKDCMLRKQDEQKKNVKDEAHYLKKIEELKAKKAANYESPAYVVTEGKEDGLIEVWSSDSEDE